MNKATNEITLKDIGDLWNAIYGRTNTRTQTDYDSGENLGLETALHLIEERFGHTHMAGPNDICGRCGLTLYGDIHTRTGP